MSYSNEVKSKLVGAKFKNNCCRRAFIFGVMFGSRCNGTLVESANNVMIQVFRSSDKNIASEISLIFSKFFRAELAVDAESVCGALKYSVVTSAASVAAMAETVRTSENVNGYFRCEQCKGAFLRGVFISCGTIADPESGFHLELTIKDRKAAGSIRRLLSDADIATSGKDRLYYKTSNKISDFLAFIGDSGDSFELINHQIEKNIRGQENRVTNCETSNINRSVSAAMRQLNAITYIIGENAMDRLAKELRYTAELRLKNPEVSLTELAMMHESTITKSGLNHRLSKIMELADELRRLKNE